MANGGGTAARIGVLLVHGVGEHRRHQHLDAEVRAMVTALRARIGDHDAGQQRVRVRADSGPDGEFLAENEIWRGGRRPTVSVDLYDDDLARPRLTHTIGFHEVWWADLDEAPERHGFFATLRWYLQFWYWGLSQWAAQHYPARVSSLAGATRIGQPGNAARGRPPKPTLRDRAYLFAVACFFLLLGVTWEALRFLARRVNLAGPSSSILVRYVGDVKLYQARRYDASPSVDGMVERPRVAIRKRMVRALAAMALADYDRWYVAAHSLGTVVAHNGLNELAETLPNYLDEETLNECQARGIATVDPSADTARRMMPLRPAWAGDGVVIDRDRLFEKLRGFLTYGSPLDKFATLWPAIVPINAHPPTPAGGGFEWINVHDPMDAVAGSLDFFAGPAPPVNLPYAASWWFLLAHISYLNPKPDGLGERLMDWVIGGEPFDRSPRPGLWLDAGEARARKGHHVAWWVFLLAFLATAAAWAFPLLFEGLGAAVGSCGSDACADGGGWGQALADLWAWFPGTLPGLHWRLLGTAAGTVAVVGLLGLVRILRRPPRPDPGSKKT
ncbi:MAG: hypothetical protein H6907_04050 [Hyphomicrobiales bacterium]|nr:hypothetical protein [Hyphomicrobiales bacterium]MCP5370883.1 hypothetical protein [Hyphomicrobiales bacterium]